MPGATGAWPRRSRAWPHDDAGGHRRRPSRASQIRTGPAGGRRGSHGIKACPPGTALRARHSAESITRARPGRKGRGMPSGARPSPSSGRIPEKWATMTKADPIDVLFAVPHGEFVRQRNAVASAVREAGDAAKVDRRPARLRLCWALRCRAFSVVPSSRRPPPSPASIRGGRIGECILQ